MAAALKGIHCALFSHPIVYCEERLPQPYENIIKCICFFYIWKRYVISFSLK